MAMAAPPPIVSQGSGAAMACASCHGVDGAGNGPGGIPALAGLPRAYMTKQIADFESGARANSVMTPIAKTLTADDAAAAAQYYAALPRVTPAPAAIDATKMAQGENLAVNGAWNRDMPACFKCHGANGLGVAPHFPALAGQHAAYTVSQLQAWKAGTRRNDPLNLMKSVADKLSDAEMQAVATYLSTLGAGEKSK
jgi:cytochrome c553